MKSKMRICYNFLKIIMEKYGNYIYGKKYDEPLFKKNMPVLDSIRKK
jgi:hypothetical protein